MARDDFNKRVMFGVLSGCDYVQRFKHLSLTQIMAIIMNCNKLKDFFEIVR